MENQIISNSTILSHRNQQYGINLISQNYKKITNSEKKIIEAREIGLSISQLGIGDISENLRSILVNISIISGHGLPEQPLFVDTLIDELQTYLFGYGYDNLTMEEIILAFRFNCQCNLRYPSGTEVITTEIFGKYVSVDYIGRVLNTYFSLRNILDSNLKNIIDGY